MTECLIIGGGFLGSHVAERLAARGHHVTIYSRSMNEWLLRRDRTGLGEIRLVEGEVPPGRELAALIDAAEVVFYLAGTSTPAMADVDPGGSVARFVVPATAVLDLMRMTSTRRIVLASSGGTVYGAVRNLPTAEDHPTEPISLHGHNSLTIERYATFFADQYGFEPMILRYSNPYGPGQMPRRGQGVVAAWCQALAHGDVVRLFGDPPPRRDFIYIDDAAEATVQAGLEMVGPAIFNVGSGAAVSLEDLLETIQRVSGVRARVERVPGRPVDVPVTQLDCSRLLAASGWSPRVPLDEGLRASWEWASSLPYERGG